MCCSWLLLRGLMAAAALLRRWAWTSLLYEEAPQQPAKSRQCSQYTRRKLELQGDKNRTFCLAASVWRRRQQRSHVPPKCSSCVDSEPTSFFGPSSRLSRSRDSRQPAARHHPRSLWLRQVRRGRDSVHLAASWSSSSSSASGRLMPLPLGLQRSWPASHSRLWTNAHRSCL